MLATALWIVGKIGAISHTATIKQLFWNSVGEGLDTVSTD
jgi:hypothetical protein